MLDKLPTNVAAIDLGSNSFHMIVCKLDKGKLHTLDRLREMVRLGNGLDDDNNLTFDAQTTALECLARFGELIANFPSGSVRIVGTNTLRCATNAQDFIDKAQKLLGHQIEIITGIEEARLVYLGVANSLGQKANQRFVMDIGGGSTEYIIGCGTNAKDMESIQIGSNTISNKFFPNGEISVKAWDRAVLYVQRKLAPCHTRFCGNWDEAVGASGSIHAINGVLRDNGWSNNGITKDGLAKLVRRIVKCSRVDDLQLAGLRDERLPVFLGGVAIIYASFQSLNLQQMTVSDGALREGLVHDLLGRIYDHDIRANTVQIMAKYYHTDQAHAKRVQKTVNYILNQLDSSCCTENSKTITQFMAWAATLHEIGRNIAHNQYHRHGAYIIENGDLAGFSHQDQHLLAVLVLAQRKKFSRKYFKKLPSRWNVDTPYLAIILRLAILLNRNRHSPVPEFKITIQTEAITIQFADNWLQQAPLTTSDLYIEADYLQAAGFALRFA